jgi:hypothetical protein
MLITLVLITFGTMQSNSNSDKCYTEIDGLVNV